MFRGEKGILNVVKDSMIFMREIMKNDLYFVDVEVVIGYATTTIGRVFIKN